MKIVQKTIRLSPRPRGFNLLTDEVESGIPELRDFRTGIAYIFIKHTSASLSINENADPTVREDLEAFFNRLVPEDMSLYRHTMEGPDDMTSHIKSSILGTSLTIPVTDGRLNLGTWQGIYLCEHRDRSHSRSIVITIIGE